MNSLFKKQIIDQSAHMAAALVITAPILVQPGFATGAISGLGIGLVREITEGGNVLSKGSLLDLLFWSLGGALAAALFL